jgi:phage terminase large subunit-like protein
MKQDGLELRRWLAAAGRQLDEAALARVLRSLSPGQRMTVNEDRGLCGLLIGGGYAGPGRSPDRADAMVWAMTELMLRRVREPSIRFL